MTQDELLEATRIAFSIFKCEPDIRPSGDGVCIDTALEIQPTLVARKTIIGVKQVPGFDVSLEGTDGESDLGSYQVVAHAIEVAVTRYASDMSTFHLDNAAAAEDSALHFLRNHGYNPW